MYDGIYLSCMKDAAEHYPKKLLMCSAGWTNLNPESASGFAMNC